MSLPAGPAGSKFSENCFSKNFYAIMPHTQRLGFETRVGVEIAASPRSHLLR